MESRDEAPPASSHPFAIDRQFDRLIRELEQAIPQRNWPIIAERLIELQSVHPDQLASRGELVASVPRIASQLIRSLPMEGRQVYQRLAQQVSAEKLRSAIRRSDLQAVEQVARQYRETPAGNEALSILLKNQIDLGEWREASLLLDGHFRNTPLFADGAFKKLITQNEAIANGTPLPESLRKDFPSSLAEWNFESLLPAQTIETLNRTIRELRESGQSPYPTYALTPIPNGIIVCGPAERIALDAETGQLRWRRPVPGYMPEWIQEPGDLGNALRLRMFTFSVANSVFDNSVSTRTQSDGARLFFVETIPVNDPVAKPIEAGKDPFPANRIVCAEAQTGKTEWVFNGEPAGELSFSGPPAVFGNRLYALGYTSSGVLVLYSLDAMTGKRLQATELSSLKYNMTQTDPFRGHSALMEIRQGRLICATAAGAMLSVDPVFGEIEWTVQLPHPREIAYKQPSFDDMNLRNSDFERWRGWQGVQILAAAERLIYAAPGTDTLTAVNANTGETVWQVPRDGLQHLAGSDGSSLILAMARHQARAIDLNSGKILWSVEIPEPAGRGLFDGMTYLFPIHEQDFARVDLKTQSVSVSFPAKVRTPHADGVLPRKIQSRELISAQGIAYTVSLEGIRKLQSPLQALTKIAPQRSWERVINRAERGDWEQAFSEWQQLLPSAVTTEQPAIREAARALLSMSLRQGDSPERQNHIRAQVAELSQTPLERAAWRQMQARDHLHQQNWAKFVSLWLSAPTEELEVLLPGNIADSRCRLDRWFQSTVVTIESGSPDQAPALQQEIRQHLQGIVSTDVSELRRLQKCLGQTSFGKQWTFRVPETPDDLPLRIHDHLRWLALTEDSDPSIAAAAAERLLISSVERQRWRDARDWLSRLQSFPVSLQLPSGRTVAAVIAERSPAVNAVVNATSVDWPNSDPRPNQKTGRTREVHLMPIPVHRGAGEFFSRMNVEVDFPAHEAIRFNGSTEKRPWYQRLPSTNRNIRHESGLDHAWTFGEFCVLQSGSEVFGISPHSRNKSRNSVLLWPPKNNLLDTLGSRENLMLSSNWVAKKPRPGFETAATARVDEFGHFCAAVGPVRPDYFCVQQMGMLVLLETSTGKELWRRYDLPAQAFICGNETEVIVIAPLGETVTRYRVLDGTQLSRDTWTRPLADLLQHQGTFLLLEQRPESQAEGLSTAAGKPVVPGAESPEGENSAQPVGGPVTLQQLDVSRNKVVWQRKWTPGSIPFEVDQQMIGMYQPSGLVEFVDLKTGQTLNSHKLSATEVPHRIVASVAERNVIVVFSTERNTEPVPPELMIRAGYRHPFVAGTACCIERGTGKLLWEQAILPSVFRLDQPVDLPVFITISKTPPMLLEPTPEETPDAPDPPEESSPAESSEETPEDSDPPTESAPEEEEGIELTPSGVILRCHDRRTGRLLYELKGERAFYSLSGDVTRHLVTLDTVKTRLEIDFSDPVKEPADSGSSQGAAPADPKR